MSGVTADAFRGLEVAEIGGIDGRSHLLRIRPDGAALAVGRALAAGRLAGDVEARLAELAQPDRLAEEAALARDDPLPLACDLVRRYVRLGSIEVVVSALSREPSPEVAEILELTAEGLAGRFPRPLGPTGPALQPFRVRRSAWPRRRVWQASVDPDGILEVVRGRRPGQPQQLAAADVDVLRLLVDEVATAPGPATWGSLHRLEIAGRPVQGVRGGSVVFLGALIGVTQSLAGYPSP